MMNAIDRLTDFLLVLGINNMAFVMLLAGILYFLPEPIDALAAPLCPGVVAEAGITAVCSAIPVPDTN